MAATAELMFLGCYTPDRGDGAGISAVRREPGSGDLSLIGLVAQVPSPSFLAAHPHQAVVYAVSEETDGAVSAWAVGDSGDLEHLGSVPTAGQEPCHVAVHPSGRYLLSANYGSGSVAVHRLEPSGGLGERTDLVTHQGSGADPEYQDAPHAHLVSIDPDGRQVHVTDLGIDEVCRYLFDVDDGRLRRTGPTLRTPPGTGPRHLARHGDFRFLVGELDGTITSYQVEPGGGPWQQRARVPVGAGNGKSLPSDVAVAGDGRFVYVAARGPDRVAVFAHDAGHLEPVAEVSGEGHWPRHLTLVGQNLYVANQHSHNVVTFRLDPDTGIPAPTGNQVAAGSPSCVLPLRAAD